MNSPKFAFAACLLGVVFTASAAAAELSVQRSADRAVTIVVTPQNLSVDAKTWDFKIILDTHTQDLSDDLVKSSLLFDAAGGQHAPIAWDGTPPGGHHREGVLRFKPILPVPQSIELRITRTGESAARSFRWELR